MPSKKVSKKFQAKKNKQNAKVTAPSVKATPVEATPVKATPVKATPVEATPVKPTKTTKVTKTSSKKVTKANTTPEKTTPAKATLVEATPVEATPVEATPVEPTPVEATPVQETKKSTRSFKVQLPGEEVYTGRYTGSTPYQAANKALSKYFRTCETPKSVITFSIRESTRGSKHNVYTYEGHRIKLNEPVSYTIGGGNTITKHHKNQLKKIKKAELEKKENL